ncbi:hypothetical protein SAMN05216257_102409 [Meinhardsimonia xiamenensis]|jgi:hypothetical protein|uniref:Uncharacterized protein n=1 Tax=Meinhardsimonia xiamenensis TaxID=990712 RepID=A0A1G9B5A3_9RHOB|nr:hypothetical protein [Meinhardsimonia xiamenensis]PRX35116.1 hypothetical protein LV81_01710 [Meinhardsimonia xiamenensis]SDK34682.1 hypothetical protein SAMN05216257_102409 [Meinhardsimonia xiamenensis]
MGHRRDDDDLPGAGRVEDYTLPFLVTAGFVIFMSLCVLWALWGLPAPILAGLAADLLLPRR